MMRMGTKEFYNLYLADIINSENPITSFKLFNTRNPFHFHFPFSSIFM